MKKQLILIISALLVLTLFAGCTDAGNVSDTNNGAINGTNVTEETKHIIDDPNRNEGTVNNTEGGNNGIGNGNTNNHNNASTATENGSVNGNGTIGETANENDNNTGSTTATTGTNGNARKAG